MGKPFVIAVPAKGRLQELSCDALQAADPSVGAEILRLSSPALFTEGPYLLCHDINVLALGEPEYGVFHPLSLARNEYGGEAHSPACLCVCRSAGSILWRRCISY